MFIKNRIGYVVVKIKMANESLTAQTILNENIIIMTKINT